MDLGSVIRWHESQGSIDRSEQTSRGGLLARRQRERRAVVGLHTSLEANNPLSAPIAASVQDYIDRGLAVASRVVPS